MTEASADPRRPQEFENALSSDTTVASFERHGRSPVEKVQHFLHSSPAAVPLIVLVASLALFGALVGGKFFSAFSMTLILQQVALVGIVGAEEGVGALFHAQTHRNGELAAFAHALDLGGPDIDGRIARVDALGEAGIVERIFMPAIEQRFVGQFAQFLECLPHRAGLTLEHAAHAHGKQCIGREQVAADRFVENDVPQRVAGRLDDEEIGVAELHGG